jgi:hypothetical protein
MLRCGEGDMVRALREKLLPEEGEKREDLWKRAVEAIDSDGNTVLHHAATTTNEEGTVEALLFVLPSAEGLQTRANHASVAPADLAFLQSHEVVGAALAVQA